MQIICAKYPDVKITMANHEHVLSLFKTEKDYKKIVRSLVYGILKEDFHWLNTNSSKLFDSHPEVFAACLGKNYFWFKLIWNIFLDFIQKYRPACVSADIRRVLTQMCADQNAARKKRNLLDQQGMAEKIINGDLLVAPNQNLTIMSKDMDDNFYFRYDQIWIT